MINTILVGIGGGLGALLRALLSDLIKHRRNSHYPLATFLINITGSFLLGLLVCFHKDDMWKLFLGTGLLGGYTTFSTFNYETLQLIKRGKMHTAILYFLSSILLGMLGAFVGLSL